MQEPDMPYKQQDYYIREKMEIGIIGETLGGPTLKYIFIVILIIYVYGAVSLKYVTGAISL